MWNNCINISFCLFSYANNFLFFLVCNHAEKTGKKEVSLQNQLRSDYLKKINIKVTTDDGVERYLNPTGSLCEHNRKLQRILRISHEYCDPDPNYIGYKLEKSRVFADNSSQTEDITPPQESLYCKQNASYGVCSICSRRLYGFPKNDEDECDICQELRSRQGESTPHAQMATHGRLIKLCGFNSILKPSSLCWSKTDNVITIKPRSGCKK